MGKKDPMLEEVYQRTENFRSRWLNASDTDPQKEDFHNLFISSANHLNVLQEIDRLKASGLTKDQIVERLGK